MANFLTRAVGAIATKALSWSGSTQFVTLGNPLEGFGRIRASGDPLKNSAVMACTNWALRTFPEAPLKVRREKQDGSVEIVTDSKLRALWRRPNPYYSGVHLTQGLIVSAIHDGNAYVLKVRDGFGRVTALYYEWHDLIKPVFQRGSGEFVSHYERQVGGVKERWETEDVVHLRFGPPDPDFPQCALAPLKSLRNEILSDGEGTAYTLAILRNWGITSLVIAPKQEGAKINEGARLSIKESIKQQVTGEKRGEPLVLSHAVTATNPMTPPKDMEIEALRKFPEARTAAVIGIPGMVAGLTTASEQRTFANYAEAREAAYEEWVMPTQRVFVEDITTQLLYDLNGGKLDEEAFFDLSEVRVLKEDQNDLWARALAAYVGGGISREEYRTIIGRDPDVPPGATMYQAGGGFGVSALAEGLAMRKRRSREQMRSVMRGDAEEPVYN